MTIKDAKALSVYSRIAGLSYLIVILIGIFSVGYIETNLIVPENDTLTVNNILGNELQFRLGVISEIIMFVLWPNVVNLICGILVGATIGFIIYGCIKGFENTFPDD